MGAVWLEQPHLKMAKKKGPDVMDTGMSEYAPRRTTAVEKQRLVSDPRKHELWCMAARPAGKIVSEDHVLLGNGRKLKYNTWAVLGFRDRSKLEALEAMGRCVIIQLPPGVEPRDIDVEA